VLVWAKGSTEKKGRHEGQEGQRIKGPKESQACGGTLENVVA